MPPMKQNKHAESFKDPAVREELLGLIDMMGLGALLKMGDNEINMDALMDLSEVVQDYLIAVEDGNE